MKSINKIVLSAFVILSLLCVRCEGPLDPEVFSQTAPDNLFNSLPGVEGVLFGAYSWAAENHGNDLAQGITAPEAMTDIGFATAGAIANWLLNFQDFILDGSGSSLYDLYWNDPYRAIRNANIILENIESANIGDDDKVLIAAEARFIRAWSYTKLYNRFGPTPLRTSSTQELQLSRADEQEYLDFIETELLEIIPDLPNPGEEKQWGRTHKGAALGVLTKFYLNTKQWQECADAAQDLIDLGYFELYPNYFDIFLVDHERNKEIVWVVPNKADLGREANISFMNFAWPTSFNSHPRTGLEFCDGCRNFATMFRIRDDFWNSFDPNDTRKDLMIEEYVNNDGDTINLRPPNDNVRPFKYWPAGDFAGPAYGNDFPAIRYADILLSRAEALNELNGPTQEAIDLINLVRDRAEVDDILLADFGSTDELNDHILAERGWELWWEDKRREDLIRHGKFIERAVDRGLPAQAHHVRFPIPLFALDANPLLKQNPEY